MEKIITTDTINGEYNCSKLPQKYNLQKYNQISNFTLKHMAIINRLIYLNKILDRHYNNWQTLINKPKIDKSSETAFVSSLLKHKSWEHKFLENYYEQEAIIMHLRKITDDCISLLSIATDILYKIPKTEILRYFESIGEWLEQEARYKIFKPHKKFLKTLNDISNGFKHCIANTITFKIGRNEPCIFVYENNGLYYNEIGIPLNSLIVGFNEFYKTFDSKLKEEDL